MNIRTLIIEFQGPIELTANLSNCNANRKRWKLNIPRMSYFQWLFSCATNRWEGTYFNSHGKSTEWIQSLLLLFCSPRTLEVIIAWIVFYITTFAHTVPWCKFESKHDTDDLETYLYRNCNLNSVFSIMKSFTTKFRQVCFCLWQFSPCHSPTLLAKRFWLLFLLSNAHILFSVSFFVSHFSPLCVTHVLPREFSF